MSKERGNIITYLPPLPFSLAITTPDYLHVMPCHVDPSRVIGRPAQQILKRGPEPTWAPVVAPMEGAKQDLRQMHYLPDLT